MGVHLCFLPLRTLQTAAYSSADTAERGSGRTDNQRTMLRTPTRILIIGCGKAKKSLTTETMLSGGIPAKDLYIGPIFKARRQYAEATGHQWYIASAQYGLLAQDTSIVGYEMTLDGKPAGERAIWSVRVLESLLVKLKYGDAQGLAGPHAAFKDVCIELHMGEAYAEYLTQIIPAIGMNVHWATKGMSQGEQLSWYKSKRKLTTLGVT